MVKAYLSSQIIGISSQKYLKGMTMTKQRYPQQKNMVDDLIEIFAELLNVLIKVLAIILEWLIKKGIEQFQERVLKRPVIRVLTRKMISSNKQTKDPLALGYALGKKTPLLLSELQMQKHTAIVGSTGSGKTVLLSLLQEHSLSSGRSLIFFDPKTCPQNITRFKALCERYNRKYYVVSEFDKAPSLFNPLLEGSFQDVADRMMNALTWSEQYYKNECITALYKAMKQVKEVQKEELSIAKIYEALEKHFDKKSISSLMSQLFAITCSDFGHLLEGNSNNSLTFDKIREEGACVYIGFSALGQGSTGNAINKLFFGGLLHHCKSSYMHDEMETLKPMSIFFDELSSIIHEGFIDLQNKCRGVNMEITYATQCPSDIDRIDENLTTQIFENTNNLFVFNQMIPKHTEFFSKTCGTTFTIKKTYATEDGYRSERGTERETEEFIAHANIFRSLRVGQCVFLQRTPKRVELINVRFEKVVKSAKAEGRVQAPASAF